MATRDVFNEMVTSFANVVITEYLENTCPLTDGELKNLVSKYDWFQQAFLSVEKGGLRIVPVCADRTVSSTSQLEIRFCDIMSTFTLKNDPTVVILCAHQASTELIYYCVIKCNNLEIITSLRDLSLRTFKEHTADGIPHHRTYFNTDEFHRKGLTGLFYNENGGDGYTEFFDEKRKLMKSAFSKRDTSKRLPRTVFCGLLPFKRTLYGSQSRTEDTERHFEDSISKTEYMHRGADIGQHLKRLCLSPKAGAVYDQNTRTSWLQTNPEMTQRTRWMQENGPDRFPTNIQATSADDLNASRTRYLCQTEYIPNRSKQGWWLDQDKDTMWRTSHDGIPRTHMVNTNDVRTLGAGEQMNLEDARSLRDSGMSSNRVIEQEYKENVRRRAMCNCGEELIHSHYSAYEDSDVGQSEVRQTQVRSCAQTVAVNISGDLDDDANGHNEPIQKPVTCEKTRKAYAGKNIPSTEPICNGERTFQKWKASDTTGLENTQHETTLKRLTAEDWQVTSNGRMPNGGIEYECKETAENMNLSPKKTTIHPNDGVKVITVRRKAVDKTHHEKAKSEETSVRSAISHVPLHQPGKNKKQAYRSNAVRAPESEQSLTQDVITYLGKSRENLTTSKPRMHHGELTDAAQIFKKDHSMKEVKAVEELQVNTIATRENSGSSTLINMKTNGRQAEPELAHEARSPVQEENYTIPPNGNAGNRHERVATESSKHSTSTSETVTFRQGQPIYTRDLGSDSRTARSVKHASAENHVTARDTRRKEASSCSDFVPHAATNEEAIGYGLQRDLRYDGQWKTTSTLGNPSCSGSGDLTMVFNIFNSSPNPDGESRHFVTEHVLTLKKSKRHGVELVKEPWAGHKVHLKSTNTDGC